MTQKEELASAKTRIIELETELSAAKQVITDNAAAASEQISKLEADAQAFAEKHKSAIEAKEGELSILANANQELRESKSKLETEKTELTVRAEQAEAEVTKLKGEAKDAETRAREIAARAGVVLSPKALGAGNQETEKTEHGKPTGTWRERAKSAWKIQE